MLALIHTLILAALDAATLEAWMASAVYPVLLGVLVIASLGIPIPEDLPLIVAGVVLKTQPHMASWPGVLGVALVGIMTGDIILYSLGRRWGPDVVRHRAVSWLITPERFASMRDHFHRHALWMCFFGRFFVGIRAVMCITAGATHFTFWKFFLADFSGALLSVPLFVWLGYWFGGMLPTLLHYVEGAQGVLVGIVIAVVVAALIIFKIRKFRSASAPAGGPPAPKREAPTHVA